MPISIITPQLNIKNQDSPKLINFAGIKKCFPTKSTSPKVLNQLVNDVFETNNDGLIKTYEKSIDKIWQKINEQITIFTPEKLETAISEVKATHPQNTEEEILTVMQKLTQWANYSCFKSLSEKLKNANIRCISMDTFSLTNDTFYYLFSKKHFYEHQRKNEFFAKFITKEDLPKLKKDQTIFKYINLEGFDDGINFMTDDNQLATRTNKVLTQTNEFILKHTKTAFKDALSSVLNGDIEATIQNKNLLFETLKIDAQPTRENILSQMTPCYPKSRESIKKQIEIMADFFEPHLNNDLLKTRIAQFFELKLDIYDKQRLVKLMKEMQNKIDTFLKKKHLSKDDTYFIIKNPRKSYNLMTQMYANINDLPAEKIKYWENIENLPQNSTLIILDDLAISGDTLTQIETFNIPQTSHVLFCPLIAHSNAVSTKADHILEYGRPNKDVIINIISKHDNNPKSKLEIDLNNYFEQDKFINSILGNNGFNTINGNMGECTALPYMAPDNNTDLASLLLHNFLPTPYSMKNIHINFEDIISRLVKV